MGWQSDFRTWILSTIPGPTTRSSRTSSASCGSAGPSARPPGRATRRTPIQRSLSGWAADTGSGDAVRRRSVGTGTGTRIAVEETLLAVGDRTIRRRAQDRVAGEQSGERPESGRRHGSGVRCRPCARMRCRR